MRPNEAAHGRLFYCLRGSMDKRETVPSTWFRIKAVDEERGIIEGIANTASVDRMGDIVEPKGAQFTLPIPLLWQHKSDQPLGQVIAAQVTKAGIEIKAKLSLGILPEIDRAWTLIKSGLVSGLSIGFNPIEFSQMKDSFGLHFTKWEWLELSAVTIPANADAAIQTIKSVDQPSSNAASGATAQPRSKPPGATGNNPTKPVTKGKAMTTQEQIQAAANQRAADVARMGVIMKAAGDEGRSLDETETQEYDDLAAKVQSTDAHLARLRAHEKLMGDSAVAVVEPATKATQPTDATGEQARRGGATVIQLGRANVPKGQAFARYVKLLVATGGNAAQAAGLAKRYKDSTPQVETVLRAQAEGLLTKAAMDVGLTTDATWANPLVQYQDMAGEFIDLLRPATILGRLTQVRRVPFMIRVASKTQGSTVGWVGESLSKPVSELAFASVTMGRAKIAGIVVISEELALDSSPSAEDVVRQDLVDTVAQFMDEQFISPSVAAVANVSPASVTNGATKVTSAGTTFANIMTDIAGAFQVFIDADLSPSSGVWVMSPTSAMKLSMVRTSQDVFAFPDVSITGGTLLGLPVVVSDSVPGTVSGGRIIVLLDQREIWVADEGGVRVDVSREASLQMSSTPSSGAQSLVSLWQNNDIGIRAERMVNGQKRRASAVTYIDGVFY
jgi:HK97 family phage major capsid protein/HK97 family phage prohead protease